MAWSRERVWTVNQRAIGFLADFPALAKGAGAGALGALAAAAALLPLGALSPFGALALAGLRPKKRWRLARPTTAMSSRRGSILRQMAAARAMTLTSVVKDSMTTSLS